jgi:hypothetical protein
MSHYYLKNNNSKNCNHNRINENFVNIESCIKTIKNIFNEIDIVVKDEISKQTEFGKEIKKAYDNMIDNFVDVKMILGKIKNIYNKNDNILIFNLWAKLQMNKLKVDFLKNKLKNLDNINSSNCYEYLKKEGLIKSESLPEILIKPESLPEILIKPESLPEILIKPESLPESIIKPVSLPEIKIETPITMPENNTKNITI